MSPRRSPSPLAEDAGIVEIAALEGSDAPDVGSPLPPVALEAPPASVEPDAVPHPLDSAAINTKLVIVRSEEKLKAVLAGPDGVTVLPMGDPSYKLPEGAIIRKVKAKGGGVQFEADQLNPAITYPLLVTTTAGEAIARFVGYFHRTTD